MENTKRCWRFIAAIACASAALAWTACSNDVELPSSYHESHLERPAGVEAVVDDGVVRVTWQLTSAENAAGFVVRFTDASGAAQTRPVSDATARSLDVEDLSLNSGDLYLVDVWAVDALDDTAFSGPPSVADSLLVD